MIKFINTQTGNLYMGEQPYIHWFPGAQAIDMIYTMPIMMISDDEVLEVNMESDIFSILDISKAFDDKNDVILHDVKYTDFNSMKVTEFTSKGELYSGYEQPYYIHIIYISAQSNIIAECIESLYIDDVEYLIGADFYSESENLEILLKNQGINIPKSIQRTFLPTNVREEQQDGIILNRKFKELLSNYWDIIANKGSYKSLINSLKWFEWGDILKINELWSKKDFGRAKYEERSLTDFLTDKYKNSIYGFKKTTLITLRVALQKFNNTNIFDQAQALYDEEYNPVLEDIVTKWSKKDLVLKLALLANFYETYFMPIHTHLYQATIEDVIFSNNFKTFLDSSNHKDEYYWDINDFECVVNNNKPIYITNVEAGVDKDTLFANYYNNKNVNPDLDENKEKITDDYDTHIIVGVKELKDVKLSNITKSSELDYSKDPNNELKDFWIQNYNGMGAIVPIKCILDVGATQDFVKHEQISINFDKYGPIREVMDESSESSQEYEGDNGNSYVDLGYEKYITLDDYKIFTSKLNEETGHYEIEIDFNLLCKKNSLDNVYATLKFDTAGGQTFVKKITFQVTDYTNTTLKFYRVEHKMYGENGNLKEEDWKGEICNNYMLLNHNKFQDDNLMGEYKPLKYQQFLPVKNPKEYKLIKYTKPYFEAYDYELRAIDAINVTPKYTIKSTKDPYNISIYTEEIFASQEWYIYIPLNGDYLRPHRSFSCNFNLNLDFDYYDKEETPGQTTIECSIGPRDSSYNYVGDSDSKSYVGNVKLGDNKISFTSDVNNSVDKKVYLIIHIDAFNKLVMKNLTVSNVDINSQIGGIYLNNILVIDNESLELVKDDIVEKTNKFLYDNYFVINKSGKDNNGTWDYNVGVSKKFWFDAEKEMSKVSIRPNMSSDDFRLYDENNQEINNRLFTTFDENKCNISVATDIDSYNSYSIKHKIDSDYYSQIATYSISMYDSSFVNENDNIDMNVYLYHNNEIVKIDGEQAWYKFRFNFNQLQTKFDLDLSGYISTEENNYIVFSFYRTNNSNPILGFDMQYFFNTDLYQILKSHDINYKDEKIIYRNDYGYFPEFHELIPFGEYNGARSEYEDDYVIKDNDVLCIIPCIDYQNKTIPFKYSSYMSEMSTWAFKNTVTGKEYKFNHIQQPYILGDDDELESGYYNIEFNYKMTNPTIDIHQLKYGSVFRKK